MTQKYYRIEFTARLKQMTLLFKMSCEVEVFWKRGQKIAQTGKVPFQNCLAHFDSKLSIFCNMVFDTQRKLFQSKQTKFAIVLYTEKGNKQAGEIIFDVAPFLNERNKSKNYEVNLNKCPDKNAKLSFQLKASIIEERAFDTLSQSSMNSVDIQNLAGNNPGQFSPQQSSAVRQKTLQAQHLPQNGSTTSIMMTKQKPPKSKQMVPTTDRANQLKKKVNLPNSSNTQRPVSDEITGEKIKTLEQQNKKLKQQLKNKQKLKKQNDELKRRLKDDDYESSKDYKKKIETGRREIQNLQKEIKGEKKLKEHIKNLEADILKCKEKIMMVFNEADRYGPEAMEKLQQACGIRQY